MSVIQRKPFIQNVLDTLGDKKADLLDLVNGSDKTPEFRSLINQSALITGSDKNKVQYVNLETWAKTYSGYLIYNNSYCVLIAFTSNTQALVMLDINATKSTYKIVKEYLDINELRRYLEEADDHIVPGEIDSGEAQENAFLVADGDGGTEFVEAETGDATYMLGFDAQGNIVKDEIPEGITVSNELSPTTEDVAVSGPAVAGYAYSKDETDALLEDKANVDGNYQTMTVGLANNFDSKLVENDQSAYNFRPTASMGSVELEVGSPCKVKKIIGGTIAYNQLVHNGNFDGSTNWSLQNAIISVSNNIATLTRDDGNYGAIANQSISSLNKNHKYFLKADAKSNDGVTEAYLGFCTTSFITGGNAVSSTKSQTFTTLNLITSPVNDNDLFYIRAGTSTSNVGVSCDFKKVMCIDLTQMFGSTIADYIYSLEQANAGSGVAWFRRYFNKPYYAYNTGTLVSVNTSGKKIVKFNQWDEQWELGKINDTTGVKESSSDQIRSKNFIRVLPNTTYYWKIPNGTGRVYFYEKEDTSTWIQTVGTNNMTFITPANCNYILFRSGTGYGTTYNNDICINFHYDGERDGEYEPYESATYPMESTELRGVPKLDSNNNLAFDGDEYNSDGSESVKYGIVDLGTLNWDTYSSPESHVFRTALSGITHIKPATSATVKANAITPGYELKDMQSLSASENMTFAVGHIESGRLTYINHSYSSASDFKTAMSGVYLVYELDTPTSAELDAFTETQECDNWGTEQFLPPVSDSRPCEVPVGHDTDYLPDLKAKLETAPTTPSEDGFYVLEHDESADGNPNSYADLGTTLDSLGYVKDITKQAILENIGGCLRHQLASANSLDFNNTTWVDLGSLTWVYNDASGHERMRASLPMNRPADANTKPNLICSKFATITANEAYSHTKQGITHDADADLLQVYTSTMGTDATAFKNAMKGILLAYEKASE